MYIYLFNGALMRGSVESEGQWRPAFLVRDGVHVSPEFPSTTKAPWIVAEDPSAISAFDWENASMEAWMVKSLGCGTKVQQRPHYRLSVAHSCAGHTWDLHTLGRSRALRRTKAEWRCGRMIHVGRLLSK